MPKDLRTFLAALEREHPGELLRVERTVDPAWEIAAVLRRLQAEGAYPAVLFGAVSGSRLPVLSNLFASRVRLGAMVETDARQMLERYVDRVNRPVPPEWVTTGPVKEVVQTGDAVDLTQLPIVTHCEKDGGPYITPGVMLMRDPDTGNVNAGIYRHHFKGPRRIGVSIAPSRHGRHILDKLERRGQNVPVALVLGHHPAVIAGSLAKVLLSEDTVPHIMGGLLGEPLAITRAETVDLPVPAWAEIVIEGYIRAGEREPEGPLGEYTGYYGAAGQKPVMEVTAITRRRDAIFHDLFNAHRDHVLLGMPGLASVVWRAAKAAVPTLQSVHMPESGSGRYIAYLQIAKEHDGQGKTAALVALAADPMIKLAVAVDADVDAQLEHDVWWAVMTRSRADRDWFYVPEAHVNNLLPIAHTVRSAVEHGTLDTKIGIDATMPIGVPFAERAKVDDRHWRDLNLKDYIADGALRALAGRAAW